MSERFSVLVIDHPARPTPQAVAEHFFDARVELSPGPCLVEDETSIATLGKRVVLALPGAASALLKGEDPELEARVAEASIGGRVGAFVGHSGAGWLGFAVWVDGVRVRRREGDGDDPFVRDEGPPLPAEREEDEDEDAIREDPPRLDAVFRWLVGRRDDSAFSLLVEPDAASVRVLDGPRQHGAWPSAKPAPPPPPPAPPPLLQVRPTLRRS